MIRARWFERLVNCGQAVEQRGFCGKLGEMKAFYSAGSAVDESSDSSVVLSSAIHSRARVAVYDAPLASPRVEEIGPAPVDEYIEALAARVYDLARCQGGAIPYSVIREVTENLIHASFAEPVVSILDAGHTIRFADQGPGITNKEKAVLPGFTTATSPMKKHIRGVGSGLPIVRDYLTTSGGRLIIEDNLGKGAVVTISGQSIPCDRVRTEDPVGSLVSTPASDDSLPLYPECIPSPAGHPRLSTRQKHVLALVLESGSAGPSLVSRELGVGISTAYRDLASLEEVGLISSDGGKRALTDEGMTYLDDLMTGS